MHNRKIVLIDDDTMFARGLRRHLEPLLKQENLTVEMFHEPEQALRFIEERSEEIAVIVSDYRMPGMDGVELVEAIEKPGRDYQVILLSGQLDLRVTKNARHVNIFELVEKSEKIDTILEVIHQAASYYRTRVEKHRRIEARLRSMDADSTSLAGNGAMIYNGIVGQGERFLELRDTIARVAMSAVPCFVLGPSGCGKELVARAIHQESLRAEGPYLAINCGAIPEDLFESELFGHKRGSFTGAMTDKIGIVEAAHGGTLFLDEVTEMPLHMQVKLLRFLQEGVVQSVGETAPRAVDVRIIAATNRDPLEAVRDRVLREDLYYRLNVVPIRIAPLRQRPEDIPILLEHFLSIFSNIESKQVNSIDPAVLRALQSYAWPGNVRELRNVVHRMTLFAEESVLRWRDLPREIAHQQTDAFRTAPQAMLSKPVAQATGDASEPRHTPLRELERQSIEQILAATGYDKERTADQLGISRATLYRKIKEYGIEVRRRSHARDVSV